MCDLRIGTPKARLGIPVGKLGIKLGPLFVRRMVRLMGPSFSKELVMTNRILNASEASGLGLFNRFTASDELDSLTFELIETIMNQSRGSLSCKIENLPNKKGVVRWNNRGQIQY